MDQEFLQAYDRWADPIFRHCYLRLSDREQAREIMQEAFTRTWKQLRDGEEIRNFKAFLFKVANRLIIDEYRRRDRRPAISLGVLAEEGKEPSAEPHLEIETKTEIEHLLKLLDELEPLYRDVLILRYADDLRPKEIAKILNKTKNMI